MQAEPPFINFIQALIQPFCRPIQHAVDFIEIDALGATVTLCHQQTLIHVDYTCP